MDPFVAKDRAEEEVDENDDENEEEDGMTRGLTFNEVLHLLTRKAVLGPVSSSNISFMSPKVPSTQSSFNSIMSDS